MNFICRTLFFRGVDVSSSPKSLILGIKLYILDHGECDMPKDTDCFLAHNPIHFYTLRSRIQETCSFWVFGKALKEILPSRFHVAATPKCSSSILTPNVKTWLKQVQNSSSQSMLRGFLDITGPLQGALRPQLLEN